jgi:predicted glycosyltransferase
MRLVVDIGHPSQVHFFKNFITGMQKKGHRVLITVSDKDIAVILLNNLNFDYINLGSYGNSLFRKIINVPVMDIKMLNAVKDMNPDMFVGFGSVRAAHAAWLLRKPSIIFDGDNYTYPYYKFFATTICMFSGNETTGKKIINIPGYKELAYLHPRWFTPCPADQIKSPVTVLRFVSRAFHDIGKTAFDFEFKKKLIREIEKYSTVYVSAEGSLPDELEKYRLRIDPEDMHDFLSGSSLLITDSGSMTTEAALLGIPIVRCDSFIGHGKLGIFRELEKRYGLIYNFKNPDLALNKAIELSRNNNLRIEWKQKQQHLLEEKIDVTSFMLWFIEQYPDSIESAQSYFKTCLDSQVLKGSE